MYLKKIETRTRLAKRAPFIALGIIAIALGLSSCAGGGTQGTISPIPAPPPPPPPPPTSLPGDFETAEFNNNPGLAVVNASSAYAAGATGNGILVAVIDTGVDLGNAELVGRLDPRSTDIISSRNDPQDADSHGTFVIGVIAANKDDSGVHGIAFESTILSIRTDSPGSCADTDGCSFASSNLANAIDFAITSGAKIINMSLGGDTIFSPTVRAAQRRAVQAGIILVASAGNDGNDVPDAPSNFAGTTNSLGLALAVGSVELDGTTLSSFSNKAGAAAKNFFLVAPGADVVSLGLNDEFFIGSGTSFSSPQVAGGLALLLQAFPTITPQQAVDILLQTADDLGTVGVDEVFGVGLMNLERAFQPIGTTTTAFGGSLELLDTNALFGLSQGAFGDWVSASGAFDNLLIHDTFDRGFLIDARRPSRTPLLGASLQSRLGLATARQSSAQIGQSSIRMRSSVTPYSPFAWAKENPRNDIDYEISFTAGQASFSFGQGFASRNLGGNAGYATLSLTSWNGASAQLVSGGNWRSFIWEPGRWALSFRQSQSERGQFQAVGLRKTFGAHAFSTEYGTTTELYAALGGAFGTRLGGDSNQTHSNFLSAGWSGPAFGAWRGAARVEMNKTSISLPDSFTLRAQPYASAWSIGIHRPIQNGLVGLTVSQPLRTETGRLAFRAPVLINQHGVTIFEDRTASLSPSGRELNVELSTRFRLGNNLRLGLAARAVRDAGHIAGNSGGVLWSDVALTF